jgi:hypothetical protein
MKILNYAADVDNEFLDLYHSVFQNTRKKGSAADPFSLCDLPMGL